jgi:uncharacterized repeat protein (TIGR01451 family)
MMAMLSTIFSKSLSALVVAILLASTASARSRLLEDGTAAGTVITIRAEAVYTGEDGATYSTSSETITITVLAVVTLTVSPRETAPSANVGPHERITRLFRICNTGNTANSYTITDADVSAPATLVSLYFDIDASGTSTTGDSPITIGATSSPTVPTGSCLGVLAVVDTKDSPANSLLRIHLTAHSNATGAANGVAADDGTIINSIGKGPIFSSPANSTLPPLMEINGSSQTVVSRGSLFTYSISFRNSGDVTARNLVVSDDLPASIEYIAGSLHLEHDGAKDLSDAQDSDEGFVRGQHIELRLAESAPDEVVRLSFKAQLTNATPGATGLINTAQLFADNASSTKTNAVVVVADPYGTVFAGRGGASVPVAGARVSVFTDQALTNLLPLQPDSGLTPNVANANPYASDGQGHFSFALGQFLVGAESAPAEYFVHVKAEGFISRLIKINVRPSQAGLFTLTERALDAQPIAVSGGFTLIRDEVSLENLADLAFNIPMFEEHGLEITKSVDQQRAEIGDVVTYRIEVHNPTAAGVSNVLVRDRLPESFHYVAGTARLNLGSAPEQTIEPEAMGGELLFHLPDLAPGAGARLLYRVRIGANAQEGDRDNVAVGRGDFPSGEHSETGAARATVRVGGGVFSTRQVVIGRVFEDVNGNGLFDRGDKPAAGVRLYLSSGQSVITDSHGLYNFPALSDGSQVLALDSLTLPDGLALANGGSLS